LDGDRIIITGGANLPVVQLRFQHARRAPPPWLGEHLAVSSD
jgi:hypothetical protein